MIAHALNLHVPPVQQKALRGIELDGADAERRGVAVHYLLVGVHHLGHQRVHGGMFHVPPLRTVHRQIGRHGLSASGGHIGRGPGSRHRLSGGIQDRGLHGHAGFAVRPVPDIHFGRHGGLFLAHLRGCDVSAPLADVHRPGDIQPHVAVNARARVPARGAIFGRQPHRQHVGLAAEFEVSGQIHREADVAIRAAADLFAIQKHVGVILRAIEHDAQVSVLRGIGDGKGFAIPAGPGNGQGSGVRIGSGIEGTFNGPVVRQRKLAPLRVVKVRHFGAGGIALEKSPAVIETLAAFTRNAQRGDCGGS